MKNFFCGYIYRSDKCQVYDLLMFLRRKNFILSSLWVQSVERVGLLIVKSMKICNGF